MAFVRGACPIWLFVNLEGQILDDTYYAFFLENVNPYDPQNVYQDPEGNTPWANPLEFQPSGTLPNNLYFDDTLTYRIQIRAGNSMSDALIWEIDNYMADETMGPGELFSTVTENLITNPQFAIVNFTGSLPLTITSGQVIDIAPGWAISYAGTTGTVTVTQATLAGSTNTTTNAPYYLSVMSSSGGTVQLIQTFEDQGAIWSNIGVAFSFLARSFNGTPIILTATLQPSTSSNPPITLLQATTDAGFVYYPASVLIPSSTNTDVAPSANTQLIISWPGGFEIDISSIQLVSQSTLTGIVPVAYEQTTTERQIDHMFNYYNPLLQFKPIPSLLTAWDFPLNPFQFGISGTVGTSAAYLADQTIAASNSGAVTWSINPATGGIAFINSDTNNAFYILQYLSGAQAKKMLGTYLSSNVNAYCVTHGGVTGRIYMYRAPSTSSIPALSGGTIVTVDTTGVATLIGSGWTLINRDSLGTATFPVNLITVNNGINSDIDYGFSGWEITDNSQIADTYYYAIVVSFGYTVASSVLTVNSISSVPGLIPTRPAPQAFDEVLRECQYYYESTGATSGDLNALFFSMSANNVPSSAFAQTYAAPFTLEYKVTKRVAPSLTFYSRAGTSANFTAYLYYPFTVTNAFTIATPIDVVITNFWTAVNGVYSVNFAPVTINTLVFVNNSSSSSAFAYASGGIKFQYRADCRLGIIP